VKRTNVELKYSRRNSVRMRGLGEWDGVDWQNFLVREKVMNCKSILGVAIVLSFLLAGCATGPAVRSPGPGGGEGSDVDRELTNQISATLTECQKIKPGMTRAQLSEVFDTEGGLSTAKDRTYVYRRCWYIKIDVHFTLSDPKQSVEEERGTDVISAVSKPYLQWWIAD
jgi:hypothetical protein